MNTTDTGPEKAIAVSIARKGSDRELNLEHLDELMFLADTAGAEVVESFYQELEKPNPKIVVGKGKLEELKLAILEHDSKMAIFDDDLSPAQLRNLENALKIKVLDRSNLILDIFASHARTIEAKTQVELAQLEYMLPRLTKMWAHLSKQYGGIGSKGPGETQIETDRRLVRDRIRRLKQKLNDIDIQREQQRKSRKNFTRFALVGYTNAGKSTLMNAITDSAVYVQDKLFATLDTTVRDFLLPNGREALISDTVGFIRKLPTHLVASFRSTLAEAGEADILVHVVDITHKNFRQQIDVVNQTLKKLNIINKPVIHAFNKIDLLDDYGLVRIAEDEYPEAVFLSAKRGVNLSGLLDIFQEKYDEKSAEFEFMLPYNDMGKINSVYNIAEVTGREEKDTGIMLSVTVQNSKLDIFKHNFGKYLENNS